MSSGSQIFVSTRSGRLEGDLQNGIYTFKGIPYAEPPVGRLRWLAPQPVRPWSGVRQAREWGAIAPQSLMMDFPGVPSFENQPQSEDCLFLNIWTPGLDEARRPVIFWIHGGAFIGGSGSEPFLEGGSLAKRGDIVLVSINYRLGALGFMNLKEITSGRIPATGNEGLLDQIAALDWVRENIASFGGNPDNITIMGFSAGGMSVGTLLSLKAAQGKFQKAVTRSGAANVVSRLDQAVNITEQYLKMLGLQPRDIEELRELPAARLLRAQEELGLRIRDQEGRATPFLPVVDGSVMTDFPLLAIRKGSAKNVRVMSGNTRDELKAMNNFNPAFQDLDEAGMAARLSKLLPEAMVPGLIQAYRNALQKRGQQVTPLELLGRISTDLMFHIPTIQLVEAQRDQGMPAYNYYFTYRSPAMEGILGAMHGLDNPLIFGSIDPEFTGAGPDVETLSLKLQDSCAAFARTGNPSCESLGKWPVYGKDRATMVFDKETRVEKAPFEDELNAWNGYDQVATVAI